MSCIHTVNGAPTLPVLVAPVLSAGCLDVHGVSTSLFGKTALSKDIPSHISPLLLKMIRDFPSTANETVQRFFSGAFDQLVLGYFELFFRDFDDCVKSAGSSYDAIAAQFERREGPLYERCVKWLIFPEVPLLNLGLSTGRGRGRGVEEPLAGDMLVHCLPLLFHLHERVPVALPATPWRVAHTFSR